MAKLTNVRERVHQPFRDTIIRTSGFFAGALQDRTNLFTVAGKDEGSTNLPNGSTLPSDQSMVVLALRVMTWFRNSIQRGPGMTNSGGAPNAPAGTTPTGTTLVSPPAPISNGDFQFNLAPGGAYEPGAYDALQAPLANGQAPGNQYDVYRLYWQAEEQLLWTFGTGQKPSLSSMPTAYFPYGGGLYGDLGGNTDLILASNGMPSHEGILRLARAVLLPPRQNVQVYSQVVALPDGGNSSTWNASQGSRNLLSLTQNLNAVDLINKVISFTFDGLFSRDVQ